MILEIAKQKALKVLKNWMHETPISSEEIVTVGEYGFAVLLTDEEANLLYETINWEDDDTTEEFYWCVTGCLEIGDFGEIQLITACDGLGDGTWLLVNYNEL